MTRRDAENQRPNRGTESCEEYIMQAIPCHYACQGARLAYLILYAPHGPASPNRGGESIPRGPRGGEVSPRHRPVTLPTQDFDLFDRLPPRRHPRAIVISLPAAPVAPAPPVFPNEVLRAAVLLMMRSPPTLAPGAGPHPGIPNRFIRGSRSHPVTVWRPRDSRIHSANSDSARCQAS